MSDAREIKQMVLSNDSPRTVRVYHVIWIAHPASPSAVILEILSGNQWLGQIRFTPDEAKQIAQSLLDEASQADLLHARTHGKKKREA